MPIIVFVTTFLLSFGYLNNVVVKDECPPLKWSTSSIPIEIHIHKSVPDDVRAAFIETVNDFNLQMGKEFYVITNFTDNYTIENDCDQRTLENHPCYDGNFENTVYYTSMNVNTFGLTHIYPTKSQIVTTDFFINSDIVYNYSLNPSKSNEVDFRTIFLHELGHGIGLQHTLNIDHIMYKYGKYGKDLRVFTNHEVNLVKCSYRNLYEKE